MHTLPRWMTDDIARERARFHGRGPGSLQVDRTRDAWVVVTYGTFTSLARRHGTSLRLDISPRTHRVQSATLSRAIDHSQAVAVARRSSSVLHIFPAQLGSGACRIPRGGVNLAASTFAGRCVTEYASATRQSVAAGGVRIRFAERWGRGGSAARAAWIVTVRYRDGSVVDTQVTGQPPQLWK